MQQPVQLILQPVHQVFILSLTVSQVEHVAIRDNFNYNYCTSNSNNFICRFSILCYRNCNCNSDRNSRRNIYSSSRSCYKCSNWCN